MGIYILVMACLWLVIDLREKEEEEKINKRGMKREMKYEIFIHVTPSLLPLS